jgi:hypothetical protein
MSHFSKNSGFTDALQRVGMTVNFQCGTSRSLLPMNKWISKSGGEATVKSTSLQRLLPKCLVSSAEFHVDILVQHKLMATYSITL